MNNNIHKIKNIVLAGTLVSCSVGAQADTFLGVYADANYWNYSGDVSFAQANSGDQRFDFDSESTAMLSLALEHGVPLLPNIKVKRVSLDNAKTKATNLTLQGVTFTADTTASLDVTLTDIIAYYELLDNMISVDVGLGAKIIDGDLMVKNNVSNLKDEVSETVPALYASAGGSLPLTGLSAKAEVSGISYDDNSIIDAQAEIKYDFIDNVALDLGVKAGYRVIQVEIDDVLDTSSESTFKGPYLGLEAHF